jgi:glycerol-3-phosphate cytidylyltransferase-like family protein
MNIDLLTNKTMEGLIEDAPLIGDDQKKQFLERLPYLDEEERIELLKILKDTVLLNKEKEEMIERSRHVD